MADDQTKPPIKFNVDLDVSVNIEPSDIANRLSKPDAVEFVKQIDEEIGSWEATILLYRYFRDQAALATEEAPELLEASDQELIEFLRIQDEEEAA